LRSRWKILMHRLLLTLIVFLFTLPAYAQDDVSPLPGDLSIYIPANAAGFVAVRQDELMLPTLGSALQTAQVLQPTRVNAGDQVSFSTFFPLAQFDVEGATWADLIQPWVGDEIVYVYRNLSAFFTADREDALLILESHDDFAALSRMSVVLQGQDLLRESSLGDVTIYQGDVTSFAFVPGAVIIGTPTLIAWALDAAEGVTPRMTEQVRYQSVRDGAPGDGRIFIYMDGQTAANGFSALVGACSISSDLLGALGAALGRYDSRETLESALLNGAVDGVGVSILPIGGRPASIRAVATVHTTLRTPVDVAAANEDVMAFIPRSAAAVQTGSDAGNSAYLPALALPLGNFAGCALGGFAFPLTPGLQTLPLPQSEDLMGAFEALSASLQTARDLDVRADILDQLDGSYALAVIPRPNAPTPFFNTPYDLLLVTQVADSEAAKAGVLTLIQSFLPADAFTQETFSEASFDVIRIPNSENYVLSVGTIGDILVVGTGNAARLAAAAYRGDNRLVDVGRWQALGGVPTIYADINPIYSTFVAQPGASNRIPVEQLGITTDYLGESLYQIALTLTLPE
jgi:hypothetical protein